MTTTVIDLSVERSVMLNLGRVGENGTTEFVFDYANWTDEFGEGVLSLVLKRQGEAEGYPKSMTVESGQSTWVVDSTDVGVEGIGEAQLTYTVNSEIKKSVIYLTKTCPSIEPVGPAPDPYQSWLDQMIEAKEDAEDAAERAETAAENLDTNGYYPDMHVGTADNLLSSSYKTDKTPYIIRRTPAGTRQKGTIVGGSLVRNQLIDVISKATVTGQGITYTNNGDGSFTLTGTPTTNNAFANINYVAGVNPYILDHVYLMDSGYTGDKKIGVFVYGITSSHIVVYSTPIIQKADQIVANGYVRFQVTDLQGTDIGTAKLTPQLFDLTIMFGPTIADYIYTQEQATAGAGVALAKAWAGITADYYPHNAGSIKSVEGLTAHRMTGKNRLPRNRTNEARTYAGVTVSAQDGVYTISGTATSTTFLSFELEESIDMSPSTTKICFLNTEADSNLSVAFYRDSTRLHYWRMATQNLVASGWTDSGNEVVNRIAFIVTTGKTYNMTVSPMFVYLDVSNADTFEPYTAHTYPLDSSLTLRGLPKLDGDNIYYDGDIYKADGTVERRYGVRAYQSGDESDATVLTDGTNTVYKLTNATTEQAEPYTALQICDPAGTEEWVGASMPVGHDTKYYADLKGKIEEIPDAPSADGTYTLKVTVSGGVATYSWV